MYEKYSFVEYVEVLDWIFPWELKGIQFKGKPWLKTPKHP